MGALANNFLSNSAKVPKTLYHYCSINAFLSIIQNSCIWLSDLSKTNDTTEMRWLFSNLKSSSDKVLSELSNQLGREILLEVKLLIEKMVNEYLVEKKAPVVQFEKNFLICFSEKADLFSQWRAYGDDGKGIAIGFTANWFEGFSKQSSYDFVKVIYPQKTLQSFLYEAFEAPLKQLLLSSKEERGGTDILLDIMLLVYSLYQEGYIFKNPHFSEEKEWRLYRSINQNNYTDSDGVDDYGFAPFLEGVFAEKTKHMGVFTRSSLKFRSTADNIRPYLELGFHQLKQQILQSIVLGPKCNISPNDIKLLLLQNDYVTEITSENVSVKKSMIPYI